MHGRKGAAFRCSLEGSDALQELDMALQVFLSHLREGDAYAQRPGWVPYRYGTTDDSEAIWPFISPLGVHKPCSTWASQQQAPMRALLQNAWVLTLAFLMASHLYP